MALELKSVRIHGTFGGDFNLADLAPTAKLKSPPILLFYLKP